MLISAAPSVPATQTVQRRRLRICGVVQGVGFRPFVYRIATALDLSGWVLNDADGVLIEAEAAPSQLDTFARALRDEAPPLAQITSMHSELLPDMARVAVTGNPRFIIRDSRQNGSNLALLPPDSHVCDACLGEMRDSKNRRYGYPFINCTNCGPRFSLIERIPYDRANTTMRHFAMCPACKAEYSDPADRRYHAQPNACPACGPKVTLRDSHGVLATAEQALRDTRAALAAGQIVAVKSLGGFHLAVDAANAEAVGRLRQLKKRDAKPFAVMVESVTAARRYALCSEQEAKLLASPARPIVLLRKRQDGLAANVAPNNPNLGIMLASAPLHYLLLAEPGLPALVMTSGNLSGYPIAYRNDEAQAQLFGVADLILEHDRDIEMRIDDSVLRCSAHPALAEPLTIFLRRARGYAPYAVDVLHPLQPLVAYGAELKTTVALSDRNRVYISQHIGDLTNDETFHSHQEVAAHLARLYAITPQTAVCDKHPSFRSTGLATRDYGYDTVQVQHHHAHMAACIAENRLEGPVLGVVLDGAGYGLDGTIWGGEFFVGDSRSVERVAHLRTLSLLGGDKAVREPIRTALALVLEACADPAATLPADMAIATIPAFAALNREQQHVFTRMWANNINVTRASSMGRLFDGIAALCGVCAFAEYEAQGPIELEGLLERDLTLAAPYDFDLASAAPDSAIELDYRPAIRQIVADLAAGVPAATISRRFHSGIVVAVVALCQRLRAIHGLDTVVLSGGVFLNEFLLVNCLVQLKLAGFTPHCHRQVPTNDGGISFGQAIVANAQSAAVANTGTAHSAVGVA